MPICKRWRYRPKSLATPSNFSRSRRSGVRLAVGLAWSFPERQPRLIQPVSIKGYRIKGDSLLNNKFIDDDTSVVHHSINSITVNNPASLLAHHPQKYWLGTGQIRPLIFLPAHHRHKGKSPAVGLIKRSSRSRWASSSDHWPAISAAADEVIMWLVNVTPEHSTLLLVFAITMAMGKGFWQIFIAVG